ncbi:hypothetical protein NEISICOT_03630 [Neisseria sicca ATCC 29256]|uniref:Uncharacterized protein n=1 Tax=Neisseria sicca ATCC 29256 TaxID=547045 RepID=C6MAN8_NEISI|nr:hypothetical protein NEISICOT_03630 [Neisseria sicca ATCC 29256]
MILKRNTLSIANPLTHHYSGLTLNQYGVASRCLALPYYLYCLRLRHLVLI